MNKMYHGTAAKFLDDILAHGLRCRTLTGLESNWGGNARSCDELVYLSTAYAPVFGGHAESIYSDDAYIIVETDLSEQRAGIETVFPS